VNPAPHSTIAATRLDDATIIAGRGGGFTQGASYALALRLLRDPRGLLCIAAALEARGSLAQSAEKPAPRPRRQRRTSIARAIAEAERAGKTVTSITTTPDGVTLTFGEAADTANPWDEVFDAPDPKRAS
jgi:hypothetical protein